jgi:hypothetical protein
MAALDPLIDEMDREAEQSERRARAGLPRAEADLEMTRARAFRRAANQIRELRVVRRVDAWRELSR